MSVGYHRPAPQEIHQTQNTMLAISSATEEERRILLGSRTGGSLSGSHFSRNPDLLCTLSKIAKIMVTLAISENAIDQSVVQNDPADSIKLWPEWTAPKTLRPIQTSIQGSR